jgi:hypothetical protein
MIKPIDNAKPLGCRVRWPNNTRPLVLLGHRRCVVEAVTSKMSSLLMVPREDISSASPVSSYGLDSLVAVVSFSALRWILFVLMRAGNEELDKERSRGHDFVLGAVGKPEHSRTLQRDHQAVSVGQ